jgi:hypothetical protein
MTISLSVHGELEEGVSAMNDISKHEDPRLQLLMKKKISSSVSCVLKNV